MNTDNFKWDENNWEEFSKWYESLPMHPVNALKDFIKSKENDTTKKDYQIVSYDLKDDIFSENRRIYSVIRLSDGVVFSVGDQIKDGKIKRFYTFYNQMLIETDKCSCLSLEYQEKVEPKVPLFTTEDGVEIYEGLEFVFFNTFNWTYITKVADKDTYPSRLPFLYFSSIWKAKEYILQNKPIQVSYKELHNWLQSNWTNSLKGFFESKINL